MARKAQKQRRSTLETRIMDIEAEVERIACQCDLIQANGGRLVRRLNEFTVTLDDVLDAIRPGLAVEVQLVGHARIARHEAATKGLTGEVAEAYVRQSIEKRRETLGDAAAIASPLPVGGLFAALVEAVSDRVEKPRHRRQDARHDTQRPN